MCHFLTKNVCTHARQYIALLFYIILLSEQKCVAGNVMKNSKVYCLISVCSCFVIILKFYIFRCRYDERRVAALPTSCYLVRKIPPEARHTGYLMTYSCKGPWIRVAYTDHCCLGRRSRWQTTQRAVAPVVGVLRVACSIVRSSV